MPTGDLQPTTAGLGLPWSPQGKLSLETKALLADSPALFGKRSVNGTTVAESPSFMFTSAEGLGDEQFSVWDGDDMTLEMLTDVNDGEIDEEVG